MKRLFLSIATIMLMILPAVSQNTSPIFVKDFVIKSNEIIDLEQIPKFNRTDLDNHPICRIKVKAVGFDETVLQKFVFVPNGLEITHMVFKDGQWFLHVSSGKDGEITIKHMGDCVFRLPYQLSAGKVYELTLGMETVTLVIRTIPTEAEIYVDNEKVGTGYASKVLSIGAEHHYKVQCDDYYPVEDVVFFEKREKKEINVELEPNFSFITIKSEPGDAEIYIDDEKVGTTPYQMKKIKLGTHVVELRKTGYESHADIVNIKSGVINRQLENVRLIEKSLPKGTLELSSNPSGAIITINGRQYGQTPQTLDDMEVGVYTVYFAKEGYQTLMQTVEVKEGKKETLNVLMDKISSQQQAATPGVSGQSGPSAPGNKVFTVNGVSFEMVQVKGGTYKMGTTPENDAKYSNASPEHQVTLTDYYIGKTEVTQELWQAVMGKFPWTDDKSLSVSSDMIADIKPIIYVSWDDCQEFIEKLNKKTGESFRLPTEAEWEFAARGGTKSRGYKYSGGNNLESVAWYTGNANKTIHPVGTKAPNELGIYDMSGNVREWCYDWMNDYDSENLTNPAGLYDGFMKVFRGGYYWSDEEYCAVTARMGELPEKRQSFPCGMRLAMCEDREIVTVTTNMDGDKVYVDGNYIGLSPLLVSLPLGNHRIEAERDGEKGNYFVSVISGRQSIAARVNIGKIKKTSIQQLFPIYGVTLGETTREKAVKIGYEMIGGKDDKPISKIAILSNSSGFYYASSRMENVFDHMSCKRGYDFPKPLREKGFSHDNSYEQWCKVLKDMGYEVIVTEIPLTKEYKGRKTLSAEVKAWSPDKLLKIELRFDYGNEKNEGYATSSPRTLYDLTISLTSKSEKEAKNNLNKNKYIADNPNTLKDGFSVSDNKMVYFSKGNLQYQASSKKWRFADKQWDYIGASNANISSSYNGWIDLFGWGTTGYDKKHPYLSSDKNEQYVSGESGIAGTEYDWGVYNTISNGGSYKWRTLTADEWKYLLFERKTKCGIHYAKAKVASVNGLILLPDNWDDSNYNLAYADNVHADFDDNVVSESDWNNSFGSNGAVFLPAADYRKGKEVSYGSIKNHIGDYWTSSGKGADHAYYLSFDGSSYWLSHYKFPEYSKLSVSYGFVYSGYSVRLVRDAE